MWTPTSVSAPVSGSIVIMLLAPPPVEPKSVPSWRNSISVTDPSVPCGKRKLPAPVAGSMSMSAPPAEPVDPNRSPASSAEGACKMMSMLEVTEATETRAKSAGSSTAGSEDSLEAL